MLTYFVDYSDRSIGGVCESFAVAEKDGKTTIQIVYPEFGRMLSLQATTGRWHFYAAGVHLRTFDLDTPKRQSFPSYMQQCGKGWVA